MNFIDRLNQPEPITIDGAIGTQLFKLAPQHTGSLELLNIIEPSLVKQVHREYLEAGAEVIETNTFGGSALKLAEYGLDERCEEINEAAARIAREAVQGTGSFVAGSVGPSGKLIEPIGETGAEATYESFLRQCRGLVRGGVDLIIIETMNDLQEAKLALLAAREAAPLPVICSMTFEDSGRTVTGSDMITALASAASFGADIIGANCSMGPQGLLRIYREHIEELKKIGLPLSVWANAGMPVFDERGASYQMTPAEFARQSASFIDLGVQIIGGCCGTTPDHIRELRRAIEGKRCAPAVKGPKKHFITGRSRSIDPGRPSGLIIIGERLNPTARKAFARELGEGKQQFLREESKRQETEGAHILDINVGVPGLDEAKAMRDAVRTLSGIVTAPLMIDSDNPRVLEAALMTYPGVAVINSVNGKKDSLETIVPLVKRFGAHVTALCLDETGIHREAEKRIAIGERLVALLESEGIDRSRIFIDPLMLAESAEPGSAMETLEVIGHFAGMGIKTSIGLSNISFGLPERKHINSAFLKMAYHRGLTAAICNPAVAGKEPYLATINRNDPSFTEDELAAAAFLTGKDPGAKGYIERFTHQTRQSTQKPLQQASDPLTLIYTMVVEGNSEAIGDTVREALKALAPDAIMDGALLKGLERVGELYSSGDYFLPQMIASATAMKSGFTVLKPLLTKTASRSLGRVVICTVRGDIHDIGKNIVAMMLENHGFEVYDLGKDVPAREIIDKAREVQAHLICRSSLLTTTMGEMKQVSDLIVSEQLPAKLLVGGAVVTEEYARHIGALYGKDAISGVETAKQAVSI